MKISPEVFELKCPSKPSWLTSHFSPPVTHLISVVFALSRWYWRSCKNSVPSLIILRRVGLHGGSLRRSPSTRRVPGSPSIRLSPPRLATWRAFSFLVFFTTPPAPPFFLFMSLSLLRATCVRPHAPARLFGNAAIMTSACFGAQAARRRPAAGSEAPSAGREPRGRANEPRSSCQQFLSEPPLPRLPSSSTYSSHPLTDPSDRRPSAGAAPSRRRHQASFVLRGGGAGGGGSGAALGFQELRVHT